MLEKGIAYIKANPVKCANHFYLFSILSRSGIVYMLACGFGIAANYLVWKQARQTRFSGVLLLPILLYAALLVSYFAGLLFMR